ncbi:unnamed protein product [Paramecium octaurelia]|uniref:Uncharacterized protein n=1 Tax=Paramecium octaurelia TaxID=43137 RepID=A0A8S1UXK5_PAROT|nr:unnamed protein product [Paramecium octaurelia]
MKRHNKTENQTLRSNQNHQIESQTEKLKTVLITKQQKSNLQKLFCQYDEEGLQDLLRFKHQLAKKIIKQWKP